jgi:hypothetical protein
MLFDLCHESACTTAMSAHSTLTAARSPSGMDPHPKSISQQCLWCPFSCVGIDSATTTAYPSRYDKSHPRLLCHVGWARGCRCACPCMQMARGHPAHSHLHKPTCDQRERHVVHRIASRGHLAHSCHQAPPLPGAMLEHLSINHCP